MKTFLIAVALCVVLATVLPIMQYSRWWIRIFDFPRMQVLIVGLATSLFAVYRWNAAKGSERLVFVALFACVLYQVYRVVPYSPLVAKEVKRARNWDPRSSLKLLVSNVLITNREHRPLLDLVADKDPDVILILESDDWWETQLRVLEGRYPYTMKRPQENTYGISLYSRFELIDPKIEFLVRDDIPSLHTQIRLRNGRVIFFHGLHPEPPYPRYAATTKRRDAELLIVGQRVKQRRGQTIVAGDLNDVAWSYTTQLFRKTSGMLDPRIGRGTITTFHAEYPWARFPIDQVFVTDDFTIVTLERLSYIGSDHFPVFAQVHHDDGAARVQEEPEASPEEEAEAEERIEEGTEK